MLPACPTQPAASKRTENGCSRRWYEKNDNMLYGALELTAKILGICKEYEAQEIVQEIANSLTMPID